MVLKKTVMPLREIEDEERGQCNKEVVLKKQFSSQYKK